MVIGPSTKRKHAERVTPAVAALATYAITRSVLENEREMIHRMEAAEAGRARKKGRANSHNPLSEIASTGDVSEVNGRNSPAIPVIPTTVSNS